MNSRRIWTQEEDRTIEELVKKYGHKSWANLSLHISKLYNIPRTGKQCRERWHNHLNPGIEKKVWSKKEEQYLFELHKIHGNKWTVISEFLPGRTDNAIKNYFYSTIRRSLRRISKFIGSKNSTEQMKDIKPSTLSKVFAADSELLIDESQSPEEQELIHYIRANSEAVRSSIVKFTNYKPTKSQKAASSQKSQFQDVISKMIYINKIYEHLKNQEKERKRDPSSFQKDNGRPMLSQDSEFQEADSQIQSIEHQASKLLFKQEEHVKTRNMEKEMKEVHLFNHYHQNNQNKETEEVKLEAPADMRVMDNLFVMVPTVTFKSQKNLASPENQNKFDPSQWLERPDFFIELKEDEQIPFLQREPSNSLNVESPGYFFHTPANNPFSFFQSPLSPQPSLHCGLSTIGVLQNSTIDEFQVKIQRQIESNLKGEARISQSSSTIGASPGSAFSYCLGDKSTI